MSKAKKIFSVIKDYAHGITPEKRKKLNEEKAIQELRERRAKEAQEAAKKVEALQRIADKYKNSEAANLIAAKVKERLNWVCDTVIEHLPCEYSYADFGCEKIEHKCWRYVIIDVSAEDVCIYTVSNEGDGIRSTNNYGKISYSQEGFAKLDSPDEYRQFLKYSLDNEPDKKWYDIVLYEQGKEDRTFFYTGGYNKGNKYLIARYYCKDLKEPSLKSW